MSLPQKILLREWNDKPQAEKIFTRDISNERFLSKCMNNYLKLHNNKQFKRLCHTLIGISSKKIHKWQVIIWKYASYDMWSQKYILKPQLDTATHVLEWQSSITPNAGQDMKQKISNLVMVGMQNGTATFKDSLDKSRHTFVMWSGN